MQAHNFEYQTAMKDIDRCLIHKAACDVSGQGDTVLKKMLSQYQDNDDMEMTCGHNILGIRWNVLGFDGAYILKAKNKSYDNMTWKGVVSQKEITDYLARLGQFQGFIHTDYKSVGSNIRYHGNPIKGWQDWVRVRCNGEIMMCQILVFLDVTLPCNTTNLEKGKYALVHFVNQDVFSNTPTKTLYGEKYPDFLVDGNCELVRGWAKKTNRIGCQNNLIASGAIRRLHEIRATIGITPVSDFMSPVVAIEDKGNAVPHSYLFLPPRQEWPDFFVERMDILLKKLRRQQQG